MSATHTDANFGSTRRTIGPARTSGQSLNCTCPDQAQTVGLPAREVHQNTTRGIARQPAIGAPIGAVAYQTAGLRNRSLRALNYT